MESQHHQHFNRIITDGENTTADPLCPTIELMKAWNSCTIVDSSVVMEDHHLLGITRQDDNSRRQIAIPPADPSTTGHRSPQREATPPPPTLGTHLGCPAAGRVTRTHTNTRPVVARPCPSSSSDGSNTCAPHDEEGERKRNKEEKPHPLVSLDGLAEERGNHRQQRHERNFSDSRTVSQSSPNYTTLGESPGALASFFTPPQTSRSASPTTLPLSVGRRSPAAARILEIAPELETSMGTVVDWLDQQVNLRVRKVKKSDLTPEQLERIRARQGKNKIGRISVVRSPAPEQGKSSAPTEGACSPLNRSYHPSPQPEPEEGGDAQDPRSHGP